MIAKTAPEVPEIDHLDLDDRVEDADGRAVDEESATVTRTSTGDRWPFLAATSPIPTFAGLTVAGLGFILLLVAWGQAAGEISVALQLPYVVSAGLVGFALVMVGLVVVTVQYKRHDATTLQRQLEELTAILGDLARDLPDEGQR